MQKIEWSLNSSPIVLPLSFQVRERNAVYVALFLSEYSGSKLYLVHVKEGKEYHELKEETLRQIEEQAKKFKVSTEYVEISTDKETPGVEEISRAIVSKAKEVSAQAIVMSAHREGMLREWLGRVSDRVARYFNRRVILVESPREGVLIPVRPKRILIPVLRDAHPEPFIVASALTSSATSPDVEMIAARVIELPLTLPLYAVDSEEMKKEERIFSLFISDAIKSLGRLFTPKIVSVRDVGTDIASFVRNNGIDLIVMYSTRATGFYGFLTKEEYEIVSKSPCVVLVTLPDSS